MVSIQIDNIRLRTRACRRTQEGVWRGGNVSTAHITTTFSIFGDGVTITVYLLY